MQRGRRRRTAGQSVVEFALILPIMLAFLGASIDVARLYNAWITLEGATRDAAEYAATRATTSTDALALARGVVCAQTVDVPGYVAGATPGTCTNPAVSVASFSRTTEKYPLASVRVSASLPFRTLFSYPFITHDGAWNLGSSQSYTIYQNR
jgi:Flp pilus assembly protein TadG